MSGTQLSSKQILILIIGGLSLLLLFRPYFSGSNQTAVQVQRTPAQTSNQSWQPPNKTVADSSADTAERPALSEIEKLLE